MQTIKLTELNKNQVIRQTIEVLGAGGLVVFPTDTVYGLLADAGNPKAVDKLVAFKERPPGKAISVFVDSEKMANKYIIINQNAKNIIANLLPGPFTVICQSQHQADPRLEAENGTLGFRIPDYPLILTLISRFGRAVTATSANLSSRPPHHSIKTLIKTLAENKGKLLDLVVDAGKLPKNKPSTVIDTTAGQVKTLRLGDLLPVTPNSFISKSEKQTMDLARFILTKTSKKSAGKPIVFLLQGDLGTGKTVFTKGLAKALGIAETVVSPTYTISYEYKINSAFSTFIPQLSTGKPIRNGRHFDTKRLVHKGMLVHYDLYRLESADDLKEIEFLANIQPENIYSIEWPEKIDRPTISKLKKKTLIVYVKINHLDKNKREISWSN